MKLLKRGALACSVAIALGLTACGADETKQASAGGGGQDDAQLSEIQALIDEGRDGLLYTEGPDEEATPSNVSAKTGWQGPKSTPQPAKNKTLGILYCVAGSSCEDAGRAAAEAAELLGWQTVLVDGKGTPQGYAEGIDSLLARKVDAIVTMAVPETVVANGIAAAHKAGVPIICIAEDPTGAADHYDAYIPFRETLSSMLEAWYAVAETEGKAKLALLWDVGYPHLQNALDATKRVIEECPDCEIVAEDTAETVVFADPVKIGQQASAIGQRNPDLDYLLTPYDLGVPAVVQGLQSVGSEAAVATKNGRPSSLELLGSGLTMDSGTSTEWVGYAAIDTLIRIFADEEPLPYWEQGLPVRIFDEENSDGGEFDWEAAVDFKGEYKRLWGVS